MKRTISSVAVCLAGLCVFGCSSGGANDVSYGSISRNLTPELMTINERPVDVDSHMAVTSNINWRNMWADLGRTFYTDQPSMLSPYPMTRSSGVPR